MFIFWQTSLKRHRLVEAKEKHIGSELHPSDKVRNFLSNLRWISIFVWFGLVWFVAAFIGNASNLASRRRLSINVCLHRENKIQFFSYQARNPISHKAFPRFNARVIIGKNFPAIVNYRRSCDQESKAKGRLRWYVP
jgi:hypothetical protein